MNHEEHSTVSRKLIEDLEHADLSRRGFLHLVGGLGAMIGMGGWAGSASAADAPKDADGNVIPGFEKTKDDPNASKGWQPVSDRKVRVGIAGYGLCHFGATFFYQNHPNVEVVAATDLDPGRCAALAKAVRFCAIPRIAKATAPPPAEEPRQTRAAAMSASVAPRIVHRFRSEKPLIRRRRAGQKNEDFFSLDEQTAPGGCVIFWAVKLPIWTANPIDEPRNPAMQQLGFFEPLLDPGEDCCGPNHSLR